MKNQWMIAVTPEKYQQVISSLKKEKIVINNELYAISAILVTATPKQSEKIKAMNGVLSIELQGEVSI